MQFDKSNLYDELYPEREIYSVSQLNREVSTLLNKNFPLLWIDGEISNLSQPSSGHMYFTLKDDKAQVRCAMFRGRNRSLSFKPQNGSQVLAFAKLGLYETRGDFQIIVELLEESGDGALRRRFEELKQRLHAEGLFAEEHKRPIPTWPKTIGAVTSATGAAIRDILSVTQRRFPGIPIIIYPASVQGAQAAGEIAKAIQTANQRNECDVLLVTRGGGSLEDLWPFNEEIVARAIHASEIPIVSAVGHEIDTTISDYVADKRAATPSAAAELVCPNQDVYIKQIQQLQQRAMKAIQAVLRHYQQQLQWLQRSIRHPRQQLQQQAQQIDYLERQLMQTMQYKLERHQQRLQQLNVKLQALSPHATLSRGYAIVADSATGKLIKDIAQVTVDKQITTTLHDGKFKSTVQSK